MEPLAPSNIQKKYSKTKIPVAVDHNHSTGKIRSLLCQGCNHGIGHFKESITLLKRAIKYLEVHQ